MNPIMIYEQASDMIAREIQKLVDKGNIDKETLCLIGEAIDIQKDLETLKAMQNSQDNNYYSYEDGQSNRRSYTNRSYDDRSWENNRNRMNHSYDNSMTGRGQEQLIYKLEDAMNMTDDRQSREILKMAIDKLEKM